MAKKEEITEAEVVIDTEAAEVQEENQETGIIEYEEAPITFEDTEDMPGLHEGIALPTHAELTEQTVLSSVRDVFRGFSFDTTEDFNNRFTSLNQVSQYVASSLDDIKVVRYKAEAASILHEAASMARLWCMSSIVLQVLSKGKYGTDACGKLAAELRLSKPYVYRIADIAKRLTVVDCYLLGMRGCNGTNLLALGQIKDDVTREAIIHNFVNAVTDTANPDALVEAKRNMIRAMRATKPMRPAHEIEDYELSSTSDPSAGGSDSFVSEVYQKTMDAFQKMKARLKRIADEQEIEEFCGALADFSISETEPEAEQHLAEIKEEAEATKEVIKTAIGNLNDALRELDSLAGVEVLRSAGPEL